MAATDVRILLYLYAERTFLQNLARVASGEGCHGVVHEIVRRQVVIDATIARCESDGVAPPPPED